MKIKLSKPQPLRFFSDCVGRELCNAEGKTAVSVSYICTDSRETEPGDLFIAIKGAVSDGNAYVEEAIKKGAALIISERTDLKIPYITVSDGISALQNTARAYSSLIPHKTVAVTGSVGKTTVKEMLYSILSQCFRVHKTYENYNNEIGVPLTVLSMPKDTEILICEIGMDGFGQVEELSKLISPDIGIITCIGVAHIGKLGSRENIARAKAEILSGISPGGLAIFPADEPLLYMPCKKNIRYISASGKEADASIKDIILSPEGTEFKYFENGQEKRTFNIKEFGSHMAYLAAIAIYTSGMFGVGMNDAETGLSNFKTASMRQNIKTVNGITVIEDCYNASPESMRAALEVLSVVKKNSPDATATALLGDMLELGYESPSMHRAIGAEAARSGVSKLFTFGPLSCDIAAGAEESGMKRENIFVNTDYLNPEKSAAQIKSTLKKGDILLVKASRSIHAENVIKLLE